jgi:hypothetical protein
VHLHWANHDLKNKDPRATHEYRWVEKQRAEGATGA